MGFLTNKDIYRYPKYVEPISKRPLLSDICVPDERDLTTGSNFNPRNTTCIPVVKIFAFLDLEQISGDFEIEHFENGSVFQTCSFGDHVIVSGLGLAGA